MEHQLELLERLALDGGTPPLELVPDRRGNPAVQARAYDSTEHFWQAVKYRPDVTIGQSRELLARLGRANWTAWLAALERDQAFAKANAYALTFLRVNLQPETTDLLRPGPPVCREQPDEPARRAQQRVGRGPGRRPCALRRCRRRCSGETSPMSSI